MKHTFKTLCHVLVRRTTADEDGGLGESVGVDLRAATCLNQEIAATERGDHLQTRIFMKTFHAPSRGTT